MLDSDDYLAQHVRRELIRQEMDRHPAHDKQYEPPIHPTVDAMNRGIRLSQAIAACWRH